MGTTTDQRTDPPLRVAVSTPDGPVVASRGLGLWLAAAGPARARGEVSVAIVSDLRMRTLNRVFRGQDHATDVLSFPTTADAAEVWPGPAAAGHDTLGDIVIALGVAERQAREAAHPLRVELRILALHGLLHLLGHDHAEDTGQMARLEQRLRRKAGLPGSLTERRTPSTGRRARTRDGPAVRRDPHR